MCIMRSDHPEVVDTLTTELYASLSTLYLSYLANKRPVRLIESFGAGGIKREYDMTILTLTRH